MWGEVAAVCAGEEHQEGLRRGEEMARRWQARRPKVAAILLERHEKWQLETRPYFSMENADLEALGSADRQAA